VCDNPTTIVAEYSNGCRIVHEERNYPDLYHVEAGGNRIKSSENPYEAQLYADIFVIVGGFTEKQTGKRGVPPTIASANEAVRLTYLGAQMSIPYAAQAFDVERSVVREAIDDIHAQAKTELQQTNGGSYSG